MKILAVDDDPVSLRLLEGLLKQSGHLTLVASKLEDAWEACQDKSVRIVVGDWKLGGDDGLELCRRLRLRQGGDYTYFILLTQAAATDENMEIALLAGVDDFLTKPVNQRDLRMRLHVARRIVDYASEVKQLQQIIPICSHCKRIRDDKDYWNQLEVYIQEHTGSSFTHGICPDCYRENYLPPMKKE